jgi:hypothetical protein
MSWLIGLFPLTDFFTAASTHALPGQVAIFSGLQLENEVVADLSAALFPRLSHGLRLIRCHRVITDKVGFS